MATGTDMLIGALLKACGFSQQQFLDAIAYGKAEYDSVKERADILDERVEGIEFAVQTIFSAVTRIEAKIDALINSRKEISDVITNNTEQRCIVDQRSDVERS